MLRHFRRRAKKIEIRDAHRPSKRGDDGRLSTYKATHVKGMKDLPDVAAHFHVAAPCGAAAGQTTSGNKRLDAKIKRYGLRVHSKNDDDENLKNDLQFR